MDYLSIIVIILSFLAILICLFAAWLVLLFYRFYNKCSLMITDLAKGLTISTARLERLPKILYNEEIAFGEKTSMDDRIIKEKEIEKE